MNPSNRCTPTLVLLGLAFAAIGLTGCSVLMGGDSPLPDRYTLNVGAAAPASQKTNDQANDQAGGTTRITGSGYTLDLRPVSAPDWLDSMRMLYRLDYADNAELAAYTRSAWADTPARMIGDNLNNALSSSNLFAAVLGDTSGRADLALQVELFDFSQHFASAQSSRGQIMAKTTLLRTDNGRVIAQKRFATSAVAPNANAAGGVNALTTADGQLNAAIESWLANTLAHCGGACPKPG